MTGEPSSDGLVQVSGTKRTDGRGQRRTNNKGALLYSSSGWLGSLSQDEQRPPPPIHPLVSCDHRLRDFRGQSRHLIESSFFMLHLNRTQAFKLIWSLTGRSLEAMLYRRPQNSDDRVISWMCRTKNTTAMSV